MREVKRRRSTGKRGGGRTRGEETHDSDNSISHKSSEDLVILSPPVTRYSRRYSRAVLAQCPTLSSPLRSPVRCIKKTTPSQHCTTSEQPPEDLVDHVTAASSFCTPDKNTLSYPSSVRIFFWLIRKNTTVTNADNSVSAGSVSKHLPAFHQYLLDSYSPSSENFVVSPGEDRSEKSTTNVCAQRNSQCLSRSHNLTEFAKKLQDDLEDDPAFDSVNGHKVKKDIAPLLRAIFEKYSDITSRTDIKSSNILSIYLERLCDIYKRLEQTKFFDVTLIELADMLDEVVDFEREKLNVGWIHEKIEFISQTKISFQGYLSVKEEEAKHEASIGSVEESLEVYQRELADLHHRVSLVQQKISAAEEEVVTKRDKADESKKLAVDIKTRVNSLRKQSLVHGLL